MEDAKKLKLNLENSRSDTSATLAVFKLDEVLAMIAILLVLPAIHQ